MPEEEQISPGEQAVAFNLSMNMINELAMLLQKADLLYLEHDFSGMIEILKSVKFNFIQCLTPDERLQLKKKEDYLEIYLMASYYYKKSDQWTSELSWLGITENQERVLKKVNLGRLQPLAEDYKVSVMDLLERKGFLVKKLSDLKSMF